MCRHIDDIDEFALTISGEPTGMQQQWMAMVAMAVAVSGRATRGPMKLVCPIFDAFRQAAPLRKAFAGQGLRGAARAEPPVSALLLSGGGQWGTFGAGFLHDLQASPAAIQPNIVTGVSTGGLQSLFVAVGARQANDESLREHSPASQSALANANGALGAVITGSMAGRATPKRSTPSSTLSPPRSERNRSSSTRSKSARSPRCACSTPLAPSPWPPPIPIRTTNGLMPAAAPAHAKRAKSAFSIRISWPACVRLAAARRYASHPRSA